MTTSSGAILLLDRGVVAVVAVRVKERGNEC